MIEGSERPRFSLEASAAIALGGERLGEDLDGDVSIEPPIARSIHLSHSAHPDLGCDFVRTEASAGTESHARESARFYCTTVRMGLR
jgi:hypothetical protein